VSKASEPIGRRARAWIAVFATVILTGVFASAAQALPAGFWGVVPQGILNLEQFQRLHRGGVESVRIPFGWSGIQTEQNGAYDWAGTDYEVEQASKAGIKVLPFVSGAPPWAVPSVFVPGSGRSVKAPAHLPVTGAGRAGWIAFITAAVARYGPTGSFWSQHPDVPKRPLRTWQIWNEANFKYFVAKPNPVEYGTLVKISSDAFKAADPGAQIVLGGLFARPKGGNTSGGGVHNWFATRFLDRMYAKTPGIRAKFNGVALHPYTGRYQQLKPEIEEFRRVLTAHHDGGKSLWITELGWSSGPPKSDGSNSFAKGPAGQAAQLRGAFGLLRRNQVRWRLKSVYWFSVDDSIGSCNFCDGSGLFGPGFRPKRSWYEYVKFAGGTP
jgi:hypothetical protein